MLAYLDASAIVKLVLREAESDALFDELRTWQERTSSVFAAVEVTRAVRRSAPTARAFARMQAVLRGVDMVVFDPRVRDRTASLEPWSIRTLDAIHIASALEVREELGAFYTYDRRQASAARDAGLPARSPG